MLIELWEHLRGYDKWVETQAKIESSEVRDIPITNRYGQVVDHRYDAGDQLAWTDAQDEKHYATFSVGDESPLYQFVDGESLAICYDPACPDRFYQRDLLRYRIKVALRVTLIALFFAAIFFVFIWAHLH